MEQLSRSTALILPQEESLEMEQLSRSTALIRPQEGSPCLDNGNQQKLRNWKNYIKRWMIIVFLVIIGCGIVGATICFAVKATDEKANEKPSDERNHPIENITTTAEPPIHFYDSLIALPKPQNLKFVDSVEGLNFTWSMADGLKTWEYYELIILGDVHEDPVVEPSDTESFVIADDLYCMVMSVGVRAIHGEQKGPIAFTVRNAPAVTGLRANKTSASDHEFNLRWDPHPKVESCGLEYEIFCRDEGQTTFSMKTEKNSVTLNTRDCNGEIMVIAVNKNGIFTQPANTSFCKLPKPQDLSFVDSGKGLNFTWSMGDGLKPWEYYEVTIRGDTHNESVVLPSNTESLVIPENVYCMDMTVSVRAVCGEHKGPVAFIQRKAPAVTGLRVSNSTQSRSESDYEFTIRWDPHPKVESCGFKYKILCTADLRRTNENYVTLNTRNCTGEIMVMVVDDNGSITQPSKISLASINRSTQS